VPVRRHVQYIAVCDGCGGCETFPSRDHGQARDDALADGWVPRGAALYCPACQAVPGRVPPGPDGKAPQAAAPPR
jgi:hypothetical protein